MSNITIIDKIALNYRNFLSGKIYIRFPMYKDLNKFTTIAQDSLVLNSYKLFIENVDYSVDEIRDRKIILHKDIFQCKYDVVKFVDTLCKNSELKSGYSLFLLLEDLNTKEIHYCGSVDFLKYGGIFLMTNFGLIEEFRGRRLSSHFLYLSLNYIKNLGINKVFLYVKKSNCVAIKLYTSFGFFRLNEV